jgi:hypothetical protein
VVVLAVAQDAALAGPLDVVEHHFVAPGRTRQRHRDLDGVQRGAGVAAGHVDEVRERIR